MMHDSGVCLHTTYSSVLAPVTNAPYTQNQLPVSAAEVFIFIKHSKLGILHVVMKSDTKFSKLPIEVLWWLMCFNGLVFWKSTGRLSKCLPQIPKYKNRTTGNETAIGAFLSMSFQEGDMPRVLQKILRNNSN